MSTANTIATFQAALKQNYNAKVRRAVTVRKTPLLSRLRTQPAYGEPAKVTLLTGSGAGVSATFTEANAQAKGVASEAFFISMADLYGDVPLSLKTELASRGERASFFDYKKKEVDLKFGWMGTTLAALLGGNGGGALGKGATLNSNTITLADPLTAGNFVKDQVLVASVNDGSSTGHVLKTGQATVVSRDLDNGTVTVDNIAGISGFAATDFLFVKGQFAGNTASLIFKGLGAWFPLAAPSDTLWTLPRTGRPDLAGFRLPNVSGNIVERVKALSTHGFTLYGSQADVCAVNTKQWEQAAKILNQQGFREITASETTATIGFKKLEFRGAGGDVELLGDPFLPTTQAWLIDTETCYITHYGDDLVNIRDAGDQTASQTIPSTTDLGSDVHLYSFSNFVSEAPWMSGTCGLPALPTGV